MATHFAGREDSNLQIDGAIKRTQNERKWLVQEGEAVNISTRQTKAGAFELNAGGGRRVAEGNDHSSYYTSSTALSRRKNPFCASMQRNLEQR